MTDTSFKDERIGKRVRDWRKERRMSQEELAEKLGLSRQRLSLWESEGVPKGAVRMLTLAMQELSRFQP